MKKQLYILAILIMASANGQSVQSVNLYFKQTLFPKKKLPAGVKNYNCTITTPYLKDDSSFRQIAEEKYQQDLKEYPNKVKEAERQFNLMTLPDYDKKVAEAKEKYKTDTDAYNKMTLVERLALIDQKPTLQLPPKPQFYPPAQPSMGSINTGDVIIYNPETLAKNYIKLSGFGDGDDGLQISIDFKGFQYQDPVATVVNVENFNPATKEKFYTKQTQYVTKYRHPATLKVRAEGKDLISGVFAQTGDWQVKTTSSKPERIYIEREEVTSILRQMNDFLNDQYGYPTIGRNIALFYVKNKKGEYDDVEKATEFATSGYKNFTEHQEDAAKDLRSAIDMWEKIMTEVNYDDSKARIDEKVGMAMMKNLIVATIVTGEFQKAEKYLADFKSRRLNYDDKQFADFYDKAYAEMKSRM